jgi:hypothetical protein
MQQCPPDCARLAPDARSSWTAPWPRSPHSTGSPGADPWNNPAVSPTWRQLLPHVLAITDATRNLHPVVDDVAWLLDRAALYLATRGEPLAARPLAQRRYRRILGDDHPDTLTSAHNLAAGLSQLGEQEQARRLDEDTLMGPTGSAVGQTPVR